MKPYLTDEEIAEITKPLTQGAARIRYFKRIGCQRVEPKPNGQPLVWRSEYEAAKVAAPAANDTKQAPAADWSGMRKKVRYGRGAQKERRQPARA